VDREALGGAEALPEAVSAAVDDKVMGRAAHAKEDSGRSGSDASYAPPLPLPPPPPPPPVAAPGAAPAVVSTGTVGVVDALPCEEEEEEEEGEEEVPEGVVDHLDMPLNAGLAKTGYSKLWPWPLLVLL
jgi:hypothetical protein